ncbi:MAG: peptidylprolyl isomerase [Bacteroidales bacterium]|nr:peptidylprolyl isomerase [Bacteroidales bacterium]
MKKQSIAILVFLFVSLFSFSQEKLQIPDSLIRQTLLRVDSTEFNVGDFVWFYSKYNTNEQLASNANSSLRSYLDKFIEYRLKVAEAEYLQLDSSRSFIDGFFRYMKTTAHDRMYSGAEKMRSDMVSLEYDRLHWDYEVAHIFVKSNKYDSPADTLAAWKRLQKVLAELHRGVSFTECVHTYSDDNLSKEYDGNVGWITAMVSPFEYENALYKTAKGQQTVVRTEEGWYILKVLDKRQTRGAVGAAIILIYPQSETAAAWDTARMTIDSIFTKLQAGASFDSLCVVYNQNENLRQSRGVLGPIDNGLPYSRDIKESLFNLPTDGSFSKPLRLPYGYAIVQRIYAMELPGFDAYKVGYEKRIESDKSRSSYINNHFVDKLKEQLQYKENRAELENTMQYVDQSILLGKWTKPACKDAVLFEINGEKYTRETFLAYLSAAQKNRLQDVHDKDMLVRMRFDDFVVRSLELAQMRNLQKNDKDFQYTMQEYHDGMIVYDLYNDEVIQETSRDSVGMRFYFNQHKENYMIEERESGATIYIKNQKVHDKVLAMLYQQQSWCWGDNPKAKNAKKMAYYESIGSPQLYILNIINAKTPNAIDVSTKKPLRLPNDVISEECERIQKCIMPNKIGDYGDSLDVTYYNLSRRQQTINEAKDQLLLDYQHVVEEKWMKDVAKRHQVQTNLDVFDKLVQYLHLYVEE